MGMPFLSVLCTLIKFVTFPLLTVKTQSPARTNFFASFIPTALLPLLIVLFGFWVTKTNELIIPLAEKVSVFVDAVVIFPLRSSSDRRSTHTHLSIYRFRNVDSDNYYQP